MILPHVKGLLRGRAADDAPGLPLPVPRRLPQADGAQEPLVLAAAPRPRASPCVQDSQAGIRISLFHIKMNFGSLRSHSKVLRRRVLVRSARARLHLHQERGALRGLAHRQLPPLLRLAPCHHLLGPVSS